MNGLSVNIKRHLSENIWLYSVIVFFFILGVSIGALTVNNISSSTSTELHGYIKEFLNISHEEGIHSADILRQSVKFNFITCIIIFLSGLSYVGVVTLPIAAGFRGFCIGFTIAFLTRSFGSGGYLLSLVSILPQNLICIPVIIIMCVCSLYLSLTVLRNKYQKKRNEIALYIAPYLTTTIILLAALLAGTLIEAYLTPFLIRIVIPYVA